MSPQTSVQSSKVKEKTELASVESATDIYVMKGEFYPKPLALRDVKPNLEAVDKKAEVFKRFGASVLGLKKTIGKSMGVAAIVGGLRRIVSGLR